MRRTRCGGAALHPSAHSYDLYSRQWNTANLKTYIDHLNEGTLSFEKEELKPIDLYNEYVMTSLRTMWVAWIKGERAVFIIRIEGAEYIYEWGFDKKNAFLLNKNN